MVKARHIWVVSDAGKIVVRLGANNYGDGLVMTLSREGKNLVTLNSTDVGGSITT